MDRETAYETACNQGFEGTVYFTEQDAGVGLVKYVRLEMEDGSLWAAEVSEVNGCETFGSWTAENETFYRECLKARKAAKKLGKRKVSA